MIADDRRTTCGRVLHGGAVALLTTVLLGCQTLPSRLVSPPATTFAASSSRVPVPSGPLGSGSSPAPIELHSLNERYVPASSLRSQPGQLVWSAGLEWPSEVWRYVPGAAEPERLFVSPRDDANITDVVASQGGYAFVESSESGFGAGGWRVWFLAELGAEPVEIDRGLASGAGHAPTIAMDDVRIVWAGFDEPESGPVSLLRTTTVDDLDTATTLLEAPIRDRLLWYPALNGDELWFATIVADFEQTGVGDEFHIEMLDLGDPGASPVEFPGVANDFHPVVDDRFIVWKTTSAGDAALNWGTLHVLDRRTEARLTIPVPDANRPSLGDRYVAFDEIGFDSLAVYDLVARKVVDLRRSWAAGGIHYGGQSISGRLLSFFTQVDGGLPQIGWAILPE